MPRTATGPARARWAQLAALALTTLILAACSTSGADRAGETFGAAASESTGETAATPSGTASGSSGQVIDVISSSAMPEAGTSGTPRKSPPAEPQASAEAPADSLAALPAEPAIDDDPQQLIGMGPASLNAFLGAPELIRREAPASLWQYRAEDCVLDIVLYPDRGGDKVTYLEARENGTTKMATRTCLNKLLRARDGGSAG